MQETWFRSLGWEDPLGKEMATLSNILAWRIPRTEEEPQGHKESDTDEATKQQRILPQFLKIE